MYYVVYVGSGNESDAVKAILNNTGREICSECFYPVRMQKKKVRGLWQVIRDVLLPGYVFIRTDDIKSLYIALREKHVYHKVLGHSEMEQSSEFYALTKPEEMWLKTLMGGAENIDSENPIIDISQVGFDENDKVKVLSGPLLGMQGMVKKINLHRRVAEVEIDFMNRKTTVYLGIEIVAKEEKKCRFSIERID